MALNAAANAQIERDRELDGYRNRLIAVFGMYAEFLKDPTEELFMRIADACKKGSASVIQKQTTDYDAEVQQMAEEDGDIDMQAPPAPLKETIAEMTALANKEIKTTLSAIPANAKAHSKMRRSQFFAREARVGGKRPRPEEK